MDLSTGRGEMWPGMARRGWVRLGTAWRGKDNMDEALRKAVYERDKNECQLSRLFGISELSGKPCSARMEVHHKTYERYGRERLSDVILVCTRCHDYITSAVRQERYLRRLSEGKITPVTVK